MYGRLSSQRPHLLVVTDAHGIRYLVSYTTESSKAILVIVATECYSLWLTQFKGLP